MKLDYNYIIKSVIETLMQKKNQFEFTFHLKKLFEIFFQEGKTTIILLSLHEMICS